MKRLLTILAMLAYVATPASAGAADLQEDVQKDVQKDVQEDLQKIVILCAAEPQSGNFARTWQAWVRGNPDADLRAVIDDVVRRAATIRSFAAGGAFAGGDRRLPADQRERMNQLARQALGTDSDGNPKSVTLGAAGVRSNR